MHWRVGEVERIVSVHATSVWDKLDQREHALQLGFTSPRTGGTHTTEGEQRYVPFNGLVVLHFCFKPCFYFTFASNARELGCSSD